MKIDVPQPSVSAGKTGMARLEQDPRKAAALARARKRLAADLANAPAHGLARLRLEAGLSQAQLAERTGWHRSRIARLERGETDMQVSSILKLAGALGVDPVAVFRVVSEFRKANLA